MTPAQEKDQAAAYRQRVRSALQKGTEAGYREVNGLCGEELYRYLSIRDKELLLVKRIMQIWDREIVSGRKPEETVIGRTILFNGIEAAELTVRQLIEVYQILKFALFRVENGLPEEAIAEGVVRVLLLDLSSEAVILAARMETGSEDMVLKGITKVLQQPGIRSQFPRAEIMEKVLRDYLTWKEH